MKKVNRKKQAWTMVSVYTTEKDVYLCMPSLDQSSVMDLSVDVS